MASKIKSFCLTFALLVQIVVPAGIAIKDPTFRSDYASICRASLPALAAALAKSKKSEEKPRKKIKPVD